MTAFGGQNARLQLPDLAIRCNSTRESAAWRAEDGRWLGGGDAGA